MGAPGRDPAATATGVGPERARGLCGAPKVLVLVDPPELDFDAIR